MTNAEKFKRIFGVEIDEFYFDRMCTFLKTPCIDDCDNCQWHNWGANKYIKPEKPKKETEGETVVNE